MYVSADLMPADSRIWIYQSNREFTNAEETQIEKLTKDFLESWTAHNQELKASFDRFDCKSH